ncbi:MAG: YdeI/OmpD-associated family protein [Reichenbachiella sp.]|uniref:YdeI/OmpD-associated family protein n=1 Tax=Reichenbachiella sp. TaxID=2184521 RepID=UPI003263D283
MEEVLFFETAVDFNIWLETNHDKFTEQWIGYYKVSSGKPSMTWPESVDQALCYGWIDGLRHTIDSESYKIRFTPRKPKSHWSTVNLKKMKVLLAEGLVRPAGIAIYEIRDKRYSENASYEQKNVKLKKDYEDQIRAQEAAWVFFNSLSPSKKKPTIWWVMSAKQESTRQRRLNTLIECADRGELIPPLKWTKKK